MSIKPLPFREQLDYVLYPRDFSAHCKNRPAPLEQSHRFSHKPRCVISVEALCVEVNARMYSRKWASNGRIYRTVDALHFVVGEYPGYNIFEIFKCHLMNLQQTPLTSRSLRWLRGPSWSFGTFSTTLLVERESCLLLFTQET